MMQSRQSRLLCFPRFREARTFLVVLEGVREAKRALAAAVTASVVEEERRVNRSQEQQQMCWCPISDPSCLS